MKKNICILLFCIQFFCQKTSIQYEGSPFITIEYLGTDLSTLDIINSNKAMMQTFYWDVEPRTEWWNTLSKKVKNWKENGIDRVWLPVISKGASGSYSMGYDPYDYFDFGEYDQKGTTKTRFGSKKELLSLINKYHNNNIEVIVDIVMGHNSGGDLEYHPIRKKNTYTKFNPKSKKFNRTWEDYHPNNLHTSDESALFFEEQDICHISPNVQNWFWESDSSVAKYYHNILKIDGWRFDYVKSFAPEYINKFMQAVPNTWAVGEFWDRNIRSVRAWTQKAEVRAFDFPNFYAMELAFDNSNLTYLISEHSLARTEPDLAVTFVSNHDTEKDHDYNRINNNKIMAYAYILTLPAYPCIFYSDYESGMQKQIQRLMQIRQTLAVGEYKVLLYNKEEFIAVREGTETNPGLILYLNIGDDTKQHSITTHWIAKEIVDYTNNISGIKITDHFGKVTIECPSKSYSIWSLKNIK